jgi:nucleotide-binding universal stress UspA family protein
MRILIATDGSEFGDAAVAKACQLAAEGTSPESRIFTAYEIPSPVMTEPFVPMPIYSQEVIGELRTKAEQIAARAEQQIKFLCPSASVASAVVMDEPGSAIVVEAKRWNADMIIVGSHGHWFLGRMLLGSVSDFVVHHAGCSVLIARKPQNTNGHR